MVYQQGENPAGLKRKQWIDYNGLEYGIKSSKYGPKRMRKRSTLEESFPFQIKKLSFEFFSSLYVFIFNI